MSTKKLSLSELRELVKTIINEEIKKYQEIDNNISSNDRLEFNVNEVKDIKEILTKKKYNMGSFGNLYAYPNDKTLLFFYKYVGKKGVDIKITKKQDENEKLPTYVVVVFSIDGITKTYKVNGLGKLNVLFDNVVK